MTGPRLGAGREAEVFAWGDDAVLKLYRPGFHGYEAEALALRYLDGRGAAPRLIDVLDRNGRRGLVLERLHGSDMLAALQHRPWKLAGLARQFANAHLLMHEVEAPKSFPDLREVLASRIHDAPMPTQLSDFALRELETLPADDRLLHGDYHPGNVLIGDDRVGVIDWVGAARGAPTADLARTLLLLKWADPLPETPMLTRGLMATGRSAFARSYLRYYRRGSSRAIRSLGSWLTVNMAARLSEGITAEQPKLISRLERARLQAA
ncbi:MAG: phosphotransferase [Pseudolysinimonas sp.]